MPKECETSSKQPTKYGEFCESMLIDPYEEIKQEKFQCEKKFIETHYSALLSKSTVNLFFKIMPSIRNAFFHLVDIDLRNRTAGLTGMWQTISLLASIV